MKFTKWQVLTLIGCLAPFIGFAFPPIFPGAHTLLLIPLIILMGWWVSFGVTNLTLHLMTTDQYTRKVKQWLKPQPQQEKI